MFRHDAGLRHRLGLFQIPQNMILVEFAELGIFKDGMPFAIVEPQRRCLVILVCQRRHVGLVGALPVAARKPHGVVVAHGDLDMVG